MKFAIAQTVEVAPARVMAAYGSPDFYETRPPGGEITVQGVLDRQERDDGVLIDVRFVFTGSLSPAVRAVVDPAKMTWVTRTEILPSLSRAEWEVLPDHYPDRLSARGVYRFDPGGSGSDSTAVKVDGELTVHVPIFGHSVEGVIVTGLHTYIEDEVSRLPSWGG